MATSTQPSLVPPFTRESAILKVRKAEDNWNSRNPHQVSLGYTPDSVWRNRAEFIHGREEIVRFLTRKWERKLGICRRWIDASPACQHQRSADHRSRPALFLAAGAPARRSRRPQ